MKVEISDKGTSNYYDEYLFLIQNRNKLYSNSNIKIKKSSSSIYLYLLISSMIFVSFLIWYLISKSTLQLCVMILFLFLVIFSLVVIRLIKSRIKMLLDNHQTTKFEITNTCISVENKNKKYELNLDEIKKVVIGNYTITFVPNDINKEFITTRIEYKDEIIDTLKKYKKENLI